MITLAIVITLAAVVLLTQYATRALETPESRLTRDLRAIRERRMR